jgi:hypothetical protein
VLAFQDPVQRVMAHPGIAFQFSNSDLENVLFDVVASLGDLIALILLFP